MDIYFYSRKELDSPVERLCRNYVRM